MVQMWADFASSPGDGGATLLQNYGWLSVNLEIDRRYLLIAEEDGSMQMETSSYYKQRMSFWETNRPY